MSGAPPSSGSNGQAFDRINGPYSNGFNPADSSEGKSASGQSYGTSNSRETGPKYPHIKDLQSRAQAELTLTVNSSVDALLNQAKQCIRQTATDVSLKRVDRAYVEWLMGSEILLNLVPRHREYPYLSRERREFHASLLKQIDNQHGMIGEIRNMITEDNQRVGIKPSMARNEPRAALYSRGSSNQARQQSPPPLSMPDSPNFYNPQPDNAGNLRAKPTTSRGHLDDLPARLSSQNSKSRPPIHPKPDKMHAPLPKTPAGPASSDLLAERFAQLRTPSNKPNGPLPYPVDDFVVLFPEELQLRSYLEFPHPLSQTPSAPGYSEKKPSGPRPMPLPPSLSHPPAHPPKLPLNTQSLSSLPRAPSPTYNPARNPGSPSSVMPPRSSARSMVGTGGRSSQPSNTAGIYSEQGRDHSSIADQTDEAERRKSKDLPNATAISTKELSDRFRSHDILLIDVRSRQDFDEGHIFAKNIICIEPLSLKYGIPAEDLEDSLIVSPEAEQLLFERRNEFDLIVYYDQKTATNAFLEGSPAGTIAPALRALHETLCEFNYFKALQRPPAVLLGGLDAWMDLMGPQALQTSKTVARIETPGANRLSRGSGRPVSRLPTNSSREIRMRRLRDYNPLNVDEEKAWREKVKGEEVDAGDLEVYEELDDATSPNNEQLSPLVHSYEDFLRKFPEPSAIQQSMIGSRMVPPLRPAPLILTMPSIPSRPPPAVPRPSYGGVSERESSLLNPNSRQPSATLTPLYTSRSISHYLKLPRTGMINFGVTCYMNATIQCLLATIPLSQFFLDNRWREFVQKNWKGSNGIMPDIFANLIRSLWRNDVQAVRPTSLRKFCTRLNPEWGIERQQDAKEFFDFLVDCLHEDLNVHWQRNQLRPLTPEQEFYRERMALNIVSKTEWDRYSHRDSSFISSIFAGQHASCLRCTTCGNTSTTYEAFYSISVEIPRTGTGDIRECLRSYCQEEMLSGDEEWKCPCCKCQREASKRISITRLPQVLVIHFKRFSASKTESARKVHTPIEFPLYGLNMEPYMPKARMNTASDDVPDPAVTPPFQYDAYAVLRHLGQTGNSGHYVSLVRDAARGCWRKFDDEKAQDVDVAKLRPEHRLQNEQAYIVFYGRSAAR